MIRKGGRRKKKGKERGMKEKKKGKKEKGKERGMKEKGIQ